MVWATLPLLVQVIVWPSAIVALAGAAGQRVHGRQAAAHDPHVGEAVAAARGRVGRVERPLVAVGADEPDLAWIDDLQPHAVALHGQHPGRAVVAGAEHRLLAEP